MSLIGLVIALVVIGVVLYLVNTMVPMDGKIRAIINVVVVLAVCIYLLRWAAIL